MGLIVKLWAAVFTLVLAQTKGGYEEGHTCVNEVCSNGGNAHSDGCGESLPMALLFLHMVLILLTHECLSLGCTKGMAEGEKPL